MEVDGSVDVLILVLELHSLLVPCHVDNRKSDADLRADSERFVGQVPITCCTGCQESMCCAPAT